MRYFVAVAEELHFGRAAKRLAMAQPPLSRQIQDLERELGVQLLDRSKGHVALTDAGQVFLVEARRTLEQVHYSQKAAHRAARGENGCLTIGFIPSSIQGALRPIITAFRASRPDVELEFRELMTAEQVIALREGHLDIGFVHLPVADQSLAVHTIVQEPLVVALPNSHTFATRDHLSLSDLQTDQFLLPSPEREPRLYAELLKHSDASLSSLRVRHVGMNLLTILGLVGCGTGVSVLPLSVTSLSAAGVVYRPLVPTAAMTTGAIWQARNSSPVLSVFLDTVRNPGLR